MATRRASSLPQITGVHGPAIPYPNSAQGKRLVEFSNVAAGTGPIFEEAQRNRDAHQKRLNIMVEETLRKIHESRLLMQQKSKHTRSVTSSYGHKFEHGLDCVHEELRRDFTSRATKLEEALEGLEGRMGELEGDLKVQTGLRMVEIETTLGPIRDEVARLTAALSEEKQIRRGCEEAREKLLVEEVEAFTMLVEEEKHDREQQLMKFKGLSERELQRLEKRQLQCEAGTASIADVQRQALSVTAKERIACQHGVIEGIASFVKRYREQVARDCGD